MSVSILSLIEEVPRRPRWMGSFDPEPYLEPDIEIEPEPQPVGIAPHVFEAHEAAKSRSMLHLAHTAPVSPGLALAAWQASEEARFASKPPRKGVSLSVSTHGFKSYRATITRRF